MQKQMQKQFSATGRNESDAQLTKAKMNQIGIIEKK
jgi:hypothetical protein